MYLNITFDDGTELTLTADQAVMLHRELSKFSAALVNSGVIVSPEMMIPKAETDRKHSAVSVAKLAAAAPYLGV